MAATVILHGIDELMLATRLTLGDWAKNSALQAVVLGQLDASSAGHIFRETNLCLRSWKVGVPGVDLRFHPQGRQQCIVHAYLEPEALHADPAGVFEVAVEALRTIRRNSLKPESAEPITLQSIALHADLLGWQYSPATENRVLRHPANRVEGRHVNGRWTGSVFGTRFSVYDKLAEIEDDPSGAWIRRFWPAEVEALEDGTVWRVEARTTRQDLFARQLHAIDDFWQERLKQFRLVRNPGPRGPKQRYRWPADKTWRTLTGLHFTPPWGEAPAAPRRNLVAETQVRNAQVTKFLQSLAALTALDGIDGDLASSARRVTEGALASPNAEADVRGWIADWRLRYPRTRP